MTDDDLYLQYFGGREQNSSSKLSQSDDESENLDIIRHSSYFDHDAFINNAKTYKRFSILSNNIESIIAKFDTVQS